MSSSVRGALRPLVPFYPSCPLTSCHSPVQRRDASPHFQLLNRLLTIWLSLTGFWQNWGSVWIWKCKQTRKHIVALTWQLQKFFFCEPGILLHLWNKNDAFDTPSRWFTVSLVINREYVPTVQLHHQYRKQEEKKKEKPRLLQKKNFLVFVLPVCSESHL